MRITVSIAALASLVALAVLGSASASASVGVDLRVVGSSGQLDDITQYSDTTSMPTSPQAECFGPGSGGTGQGVSVPGANALGVVVEAAESRQRLNPLQLTDKFVPDGFGLGVCGIGGQVAAGSAFWYTKVDHTGLQVGGSQFPVHAGQEVLWYLAPNFPAPPELVLNAPVASRRGPVPRSGARLCGRRDRDARGRRRHLRRRLPRSRRTAPETPRSVSVEPVSISSRPRSVRTFRARWSRSARLTPPPRVPRHGGG